MKTDIMVHCGNAPKMQRVIDLTVEDGDRLNFCTVVKFVNHGTQHPHSADHQFRRWF